MVRAPVRIFALMLNFEGLGETRRALASLSLVDGLAGTIVLDNGSARDESSALRDEFPRVDVRRSEDNLGFSRGVNLIASAALMAGATHLLLINNDAEFSDSWAPLEKLVEAFDVDPKRVAVGPVIRNRDGSVQSAGYAYTRWVPIPRARCRVSDRTTDVRGFLSGSCVLLDAAKFATLGGFDPDFFLYGEDLDFALRAASAGMTFALVPTVTVDHGRAVTSNLYSRRYVYTVLRGNLIVSAKHARWYHWPSTGATFVLSSVALAILGLSRGHADAPKAAVLAWIDFFRKRWSGLTGAPLEACARPSLKDCSSIRSLWSDGDVDTANLARAT